MTTRSGLLRLLWIGIPAVIAALVGYVAIYREPATTKSDDLSAPAESGGDIDREVQARANPRVISGKQLLLWIDPPPLKVRETSRVPGFDSNIHRADYVGPDRCRKCHRENYEHWSRHPHRWMNALATAKTVRGDFSGVSIEYRGGRAVFTSQGDSRRMVLTRGDERIVYEVEQTIGSRFFQYYIGKLREGPVAADHPFRHRNHVLPFGFWLDQQEWVPTVHIGPELQDQERVDPHGNQPKNKNSRSGRTKT